MRPNPLVKRTVHGAGELIEQQLSAARNSRYGSTAFKVRLAPHAVGLSSAPGPEGWMLSAPPR